MTQVRKGNVTVTNGDPLKYENYFKTVFPNECEKLIVCKELKKKSQRIHYELYCELYSDSVLNDKPRKGSELFRDALEKSIGCKLVGKSNDFAFPIARNPVNAMSYTLKDGDIIFYKGYTPEEIQEKKKLWVKKEKASSDFVSSVVENFTIQMNSDPSLQPRDLWSYIISRYQARGRPFGDHQLCSVFNITCLTLFPNKYYKYSDDLFEKKYSVLL